MLKAALTLAASVFALMFDELINADPSPRIALICFQSTSVEAGTSPRQRKLATFAIKRSLLSFATLPLKQNQQILFGKKLNENKKLQRDYSIK